MVPISRACGGGDVSEKGGGANHSLEAEIATKKMSAQFSGIFGNGQLSLIFGVPNCCAYSPSLVAQIDKGRGAKKCKNWGHQKLGTVGRF